MGHRDAKFKVVEHDHAIDSQAPQYDVQARSLDGGMTWKFERPLGLTRVEDGGPQVRETPVQAGPVAGPGPQAALGGPNGGQQSPEPRPQQSSFQGNPSHSGQGGGHQHQQFRRPHGGHMGRPQGQGGFQQRQGGGGNFNPNFKRPDKQQPLPMVEEKEPEFNANVPVMNLKELKEKHISDLVQMVRQLMTLVYAQQKVVIEAENALQPTAEKLGVIEKAIAMANARIIAVEKERDEAEQKYQDLCTHLADVEQGHLNEMQELYNSMQE